jgi:two-component system, response regulator PdtaR
MNRRTVSGLALMLSCILRPVLNSRRCGGRRRAETADIQMPGSCNGMDLARQIHARWPNILLVITSGQIKPPQAEIPDDGRFVAKPYRANQRLGGVNDLMRNE